MSHCAVGVCSSPVHCREIGRCFSASSMAGQTTADDIKQETIALIRRAAAIGLVIRVEQVSEKPPAMGNYTTRISVFESHAARKDREHRERAAKGAP